MSLRLEIGTSRICWDPSMDSDHPVLNLPLNLKIPIGEILTALDEFKKTESAHETMQSTFIHQPFTKAPSLVSALDVVQRRPLSAAQLEAVPMGGYGRPRASPTHTVPYSSSESAFSRLSTEPESEHVSTTTRKLDMELLNAACLPSVDRSLASYAARSLDDRISTHFMQGAETFDDDVKDAVSTADAGVDEVASSSQPEQSIVRDAEQETKGYEDRTVAVDSANERGDMQNASDKEVKLPSPSQTEEASSVAARIEIGEALIREGQVMASSDLSLKEAYLKHMEGLKALMQIDPKPDALSDKVIEYLEQAEKLNDRLERSTVWAVRLSDMSYDWSLEDVQKLLSLHGRPIRIREVKDGMFEAQVSSKDEAVEMEKALSKLQITNAAGNSISIACALTCPGRFPTSPFSGASASDVATCADSRASASAAERSLSAGASAPEVSTHPDLYAPDSYASASQSVADSASEIATLSDSHASASVADWLREAEVSICRKRQFSKDFIEQAWKMEVARARPSG